MKKLLLILLFFLIVPLQAASAQKIDYALPYPGLLPDSPLYILKLARDQIINFFITDPLKKSQFDLLQADKRLASGQYLFAKGSSKYPLMVSTISKGENYLEMAIDNLKVAQKQGEDISGFKSTLETAAKKHQEVIKDLISKTNGDVKKNLQNEEKRVEDLVKNTEQFR